MEEEWTVQNRYTSRDGGSVVLFPYLLKKNSSGNTRATLDEHIRRSSTSAFSFRALKFVKNII